MIEGLRLLPYFQETRRVGSTVGASERHGNDCTACRAKMSTTDRQDRGCVYEERTAAPSRGFVLNPRLPWRSVTGIAIAPTVCPLFLGRVAEASDVIDALPHFRRGIGNLRAYLGREPEPSLLEALEAAEDGRAHWDGDPNGGARKAGA